MVEDHDSKVFGLVGRQLGVSYLSSDTALRDGGDFEEGVVEIEATDENHGTYLLAGEYKF